MRRFGKNKKIFVQHLLIDILREKGFEFKSTLARNTGKTLRLERIEQIYYNGQLFMDFDVFIERGTVINSVITEILESQTVWMIPQGVDVTLMASFNEFFHAN